MPVFPDCSGIFCDRIRQRADRHHASALMTSAAVLLVYRKNSASPALRAMSIMSSAVGVVLPDRNCINYHLADRANSKSSPWTKLTSKGDGSMLLSRLGERIDFLEARRGRQARQYFLRQLANPLSSCE